MSALIDIWTSELARLREKGQTIFSGGPSPAGAESTQTVHPEQSNNQTELVQAFSNRVKRLKFAQLLSSEASLSMFLESFSP